MVKTLGFGRLPRHGGTGLKVVVGSVVAGGTPGSFAVPLNYVRHLTVRVISTAGTNHQVRPIGSTKSGYAFVMTTDVGTSGYPVGTATKQAISFEALGE